MPLLRQEVRHTVRGGVVQVRPQEQQQQQQQQQQRRQQHWQKKSKSLVWIETAATAAITLGLLSYTRTNTLTYQL